MAATGKKNVTETDDRTHLVPEYGFDLKTAGIAGNLADTATMMGRDGKWLAGEHIPCYATGRTDRKAPKFPGVGGNLRGVSVDLERDVDA